MKYSNIRIFGSRPEMCTVTCITARYMDILKFSSPRIYYEISAQRERRLYKYERNDLTNCEILRTCKPFNGNAVEIPENNSEET